MPYLYPILAALLPILACSLITGFNPLRLTQNYLIARNSKFPLLITPPHPNYIPWQILGVPLRPLLRSILPPVFFSRINHTTYGYEWTERRSTHSRLGQTFIAVTSGNNELNVADPVLATEILRRPKDFRQTLVGSKVMRIFGDNLITSDGEHWSRQRRLVASNVNEKISGLVWGEARTQTGEMLEYYAKEKGGVTDEFGEGLKIIAINILGVAGYGVRSSWVETMTVAGGGKQVEKEQNRQEEFKLTYIEATRLAIDHIVEASLLPSWIFLLNWMPEGVKRIGYAKKEFAAHTQGMLDRERQRIHNGESERVNMLSMLVKEGDSQNGSAEKDEKKAAGLTEDEIMGNLFVFTAAGFDTTANTMTYAITMLAANPQWQDWMGEEIDRVLGDKTDDAELEYNEIFPQLTRVLAVMVSI
jgi:cytochrome P450